MTAESAPAPVTAPQTRARIALVALFSAESISSIGSRMTFLAIPWLVLVTTGEPARVGLVAFAETLPYVLAGVFATPLADRIGVRISSIVTDLGSAAVMAGVAIVGRHHYPALLLLAAVLGMLRGVGDKSKRVLMPPIADAAGVSMPRVTATFGSLNRMTTLIGAGLGGVVIAWLGAVGAIWFDAATFAICALVILLLIPAAGWDKGTEPAGSAPPAPPARAGAGESYLESLRAGFRFLRSDRLVRGFVSMMLITNLFNQAAAVVFIPVWVLEHIGSPYALGWFGGAFAVGGLLGNLTFIALVNRMPRYATLVTGYFIGGAPRFLILAVTDDLRVAMVVAFVAGIAMSSINPTYGLTLYQRVPRPLQTRVFGLAGSVAFAGIPVGGLVGAWAVESLGLDGGLLLAAVLYFCATLSPVVAYRYWRELDELPEVNVQTGGLDPSWLARGKEAVGWLIPSPAATGWSPLTVQLRYRGEGRWRVGARKGRTVIAAECELPPGRATAALRSLAVPEVNQVVHAVGAAEAAQARRRAATVRERLEELDAHVGAVEHRAVPAPSPRGGPPTSPEPGRADRAPEPGQVGSVPQPGPADDAPEPAPVHAASAPTAASVHTRAGGTPIVAAHTGGVHDGSRPR